MTTVASEVLLVSAMRAGALIASRRRTLTPAHRVRTRPAWLLPPSPAGRSFDQGKHPDEQSRVGCAAVPRVPLLAGGSAQEAALRKPVSLVSDVSGDLGCRAAAHRSTSPVIACTQSSRRRYLSLRPVARRYAGTASAEPQCRLLQTCDLLGFRVRAGRFLLRCKEQPMARARAATMCPRCGSPVDVLSEVGTQQMLRCVECWAVWVSRTGELSPAPTPTPHSAES
jgi:hypothetical protein